MNIETRGDSALIGSVFYDTDRKGYFERTADGWVQVSPIVAYRRKHESDAPQPPERLTP